MAPRKSGKSTEASPSGREALLNQLQKKYEGVYIGVDRASQYKVLPTGSLLLDIALGIGGIPSGRIVEIGGQESSGKSTIALKIAANAQAKGYTVAFIDTEHALDFEWAEKHGVDTDDTSPDSKFIYIAPDNLEAAGEVAVEIAKSGIAHVIIFDSVAGAAITAVLEGDLGDANMGKRAKIMSDFLPKLNAPVKQNDLWFVFINQSRSAMGAQRGTGGRWSETVFPGGKALDFHSSIIVSLGTKRPTKDDLEKAGDSYTTVTFDVVKNKMAPPFKTGEYRLYHDGTIDEIEELTAVLLTEETREMVGIERAGAWYYVPMELVPKGYTVKQNDKGKGQIQGSEGLKNLLASDVGHAKSVIQFVRRHLISNEDKFAQHTAGAA